MKECKTCGAPVYPPGISYVGVSCAYGGDHPFTTIQTSNLAEPIMKLTEAIERLTEKLPPAPTSESKQ